MSKLSKMSQSREAKNMYNHPIKDLLKQRYTKAQLKEYFHESEREIRRMVAECSMYYPIISLSKRGEGYRRAIDIENATPEELTRELNIVRKTISEHNSRIKCLKKKLKPLIAWKKVAEKKLRNEHNCS